MTFNEWSLSHDRNYWYSELCIAWPCARPSTKYLGKMSLRVNISLGWILQRFMPQSKLDHSAIWSFVKSGFLPSSCISQFVNMEIIVYKQCKLRIENISHSLGQDLRLKHALLNCWQYVIKCRSWFNDDNTDIGRSVYMTLNIAYPFQPLKK